MTKKVSIVMCTYNGGQHLREQLDSILNQTYPIFEIYIQDDCSTDNTVKIIEEYKKKQTNIRYKINKKNLGYNDNFLTALYCVEGKYIAIADQDDIWYPEKIEKQVQCIGENLLCHCRSIPFSNDGAKIYIDETVLNYSLARSLFTTPIMGHNMLIKDELLQLMPTNCLPELAYDHLISITANVYNRITFMNEFLCNHRRHYTAASYTEPDKYNRTIKNIIHYFLDSVRLFLLLRPKVRFHYVQFLQFLKMHKGTNNLQHVDECKKVVILLSKQSFFSLIKESKWFIRHRDEIFYKKEKKKVISICRAALFPIFLYQYWNHLSQKK